MKEPIKRKRITTGLISEPKELLEMLSSLRNRREPIDPIELTKLLSNAPEPVDFSKHKKGLKTPEPYIFPKSKHHTPKAQDDPPELKKLIYDLRKKGVPVINVHKELK